MMELVDMQDLGSCGAIRRGSSPRARTSRITRFRRVILLMQRDCSAKGVKSLRKLIAAALAVIVLLTLCACGLFDDDVPREKIFEYVRDNEELLMDFMQQNPQKDKLDKLGNPTYDFTPLGRRTIVKNMHAYTDSVIQFYCGGTGLSTNSTYSGFYYSADDTPYAFEFPTDELEETSPGVFEWASRTGEAIVTERILPCWFYYHMIWY